MVVEVVNIESRVMSGGGGGQHRNRIMSGGGGGQHRK